MHREREKERERQSAWHQTAVNSRMGCVRAPCCQEAGRRRKQTPANGDITCSPEQKLKQTINGQWTLCSRFSLPLLSLSTYLCPPRAGIQTGISESQQRRSSPTVQERRPHAQILEHVSHNWPTTIRLIHHFITTISNTSRSTHYTFEITKRIELVRSNEGKRHFLNWSIRRETFVCTRL